MTAKPVAPGDAARGVPQRLRFPAGTRIDPRLTVALTDQSRHDPLREGMTVHLATDHPSVVTVSDAGLTTHHPGVATITATVAYHGGTAQGSFVVVVS